MLHRLQRMRSNVTHDRREPANDRNRSVRIPRTHCVDENIVSNVVCVHTVPDKDGFQLQCIPGFCLCYI